MRLGADKERLTWVNIWQDEEAASYVRTLRNGDETVPTVITGNGVLLDASADAIRQHLDGT